MKMFNRCFILALTLILNACAAAVLAGAAGSYIIYDDRSMRTLEKDARIFHVIHKAIVRDNQLATSHINVTSFKQVVLLTGQTPYASGRAITEKVARQAPNVRRIYNEITIQNPSSAWQRTQDTGITSNVRTHMLTKKGLESGAIRIVTENGVVYLMGDVTHPQAELAVNVARQVPGVQKVVKVFQYLDN
jgi:osmotically-inducible protein OsmY